VEQTRNIRVVVESRPADSMLLRLMRWFATHAKTTAVIVWAVIVVLGISGHAALLNGFGINLFSLARWDELLFLWIDASATFSTLGKILLACLGLVGGYAAGVLLFEKMLADLGWWSPWPAYDAWIRKLNETGRDKPINVLVIYVGLILLGATGAMSLLSQATDEAMGVALADNYSSAAGWVIALLMGGALGLLFSVVTVMLCSHSVVVQKADAGGKQANVTLYAIVLFELLVIFSFLSGVFSPVVYSVAETFPDKISRQQPYVVEYVRKDALCVQTGYLFSTFGGYHLLYDPPVRVMHLIPTRAVQHMQRRRPEREPQAANAPWLRISTCAPEGLAMEGAPFAFFGLSAAELLSDIGTPPSVLAANRSRCS
jgi:hypothetical protein